MCETSVPAGSFSSHKFDAVDDDQVDNQVPPLAFTYVTEPVLGDSVKLHQNPNLYVCCSCTDNCRDPTKCECARAMDGFAYNDHKQLQEPKTCIYECNLFCACHTERCSNRVVGQGLKLPLEVKSAIRQQNTPKRHAMELTGFGRRVLQVFRCPEREKGWGVRCLETIPAGTYVTDYIGEILTESKAEERGMKKGDEYLFTLDMWTKQKALLVSWRIPLPVGTSEHQLILTEQPGCGATRHRHAAVCSAGGNTSQLANTVQRAASGHRGRRCAWLCDL